PPRWAGRTRRKVRTRAADKSLAPRSCRFPLGELFRSFLERSHENFHEIRLHSIGLITNSECLQRRNRFPPAGGSNSTSRRRDRRLATRIARCRFGFAICP